MYNSFADVEKICRERGWTPAHLFLENEKKLTGRSEEEILRALDERLRVMEDAAARALNGPLHAVGGLIDGVAEKQWRYAAGETLCGGFLNRVMARAYSCSEVNASMGRICAAPTAGSCGILPAVLLTMQEARGLSRSEVIDALLTASGFGAVVMKNATVAGAEGGCQAECGVAAAMAACAAALCRRCSPRFPTRFRRAWGWCATRWRDWCRCRARSATLRRRSAPWSAQIRRWRDRFFRSPPTRWWGRCTAWVVSFRRN